MPVKHKEYLIKNINDLQSYPTNARFHSEKQIQLLADYISKTGFIDPIIIDENDQVLAGHCRVYALNVLDKPDAECLRVFGLTELEKRAYVIADNKLAEMGSWDNNLITAEVLQLMSEQFDLKEIGFDDLDIEHFQIFADSKNEKTPDIDLSNDQVEGFASSSNDTVKHGGMVEIKITQELVESETFRLTLSNICDEYRLTYKIKAI
jgi:hypothetical protein